MTVGTYVPRYTNGKTFRLSLEQLSNLHYGEVVMLDALGSGLNQHDNEIFEWCRDQNIKASWMGRFYIDNKVRKDIWVVQGEAKRLLFALRWM